MTVVADVPVDADIAGADLSYPAAPDAIAAQCPYRVGYWALGTVAAVLTFVLIRYTDDLAFINWRYGQTLAHAGVWNWNRTGPEVNAYSSYLYAMLSAVPAYAGISTELFFKGISLLTLAAYVVWTCRLGLPRAQHLVLLGVALVSPVFFIQLFSGLETVPFAVAITVLFATLYRNGRLGPVGYALAVVVMLLRPEGIAFALVAVAWALILDRRRGHVVGAAAVAIISAGYWTWQARFFGWFWPNGLYAGSRNGSASAQISHEFGWLMPALVVAGLVLLALALLGGARLRAARQRGTASMRRQLGSGPLCDATPFVLAVVSALIVFAVYDQLTLSTDFANRFIWQAVFPIVGVVLARPLAGREGEAQLSRPDGWAIAGIGLATVTAAQSLGVAHHRQAVLIAAILIVALAAGLRLLISDSAATIVAAAALAVLVSWMSLTDVVGFAAYRYRLQDAHQALGAVIADAHIDGAVATGDADVLPYELKQRVIDLEGRATATVAHRTFSAAELSAARVRVIIAPSSTPGSAGEFEPTIGQQVAYQWAQASDFRFFSGPEFDGGYYLNVWVAPSVASTAFVTALDNLAPRSADRASANNTSLFMHHLLDFPFVSGT
jgi:hypothetical protein